MVSATPSSESADTWGEADVDFIVPRAPLAVSAPARLPVVVPVLTPVSPPPSPPSAPPVPAPTPSSATDAPPMAADPPPPSVTDTPRAPKVTRPIEPAELEPGPLVAPELWVRESELEVWEVTRTLITGKRPIARPHSQPLPQPQRFHAPVPWRSAAILGVFLLIAVVLVIGAVQAAHLSTQLLGAPHLPPTPHLTPTAPHVTPSVPHTTP